MNQVRQPKLLQMRGSSSPKEDKIFRNRSFIVLVPLALLAAGAIIQGCASAPAPVPTIEANKALVRRYYDQALNMGNLNVLDELLAPNYKRYLTATAAPLGAAAQKQRLGGMRAVFPDLNVTIDDLIAVGDRVAIRMTVRGTQKVAFMGVPPTGRQGTVSALEIVRIENGKIVEHWGGTDNLDLVQQLGGVVTAAPPKTFLSSP